MNMWALPSSQRFIAKIAQKMTDGQFCVVMLPETLGTTQLVEAFERHTFLEELGTCDIVDAIPDMALTQSLCRTNFNERGDVHANIDELLDTPASGSFLVVRIPSKECEAARTMAATLRELAVGAKQRKDSGKALHWTLLVVTSAVFPPLESDAGLEVLYWQGIWRKVDVELVFDECLRHLPPASDALGWWLYALCLGFGMTDPILCSELFRNTPYDMSSITDFFSRHPVSDTVDQAISNSLISYDNTILSRPGPIRRESAIIREEELTLWARGLLDCTETGDFVLHPAALAKSKRFASLERMACHGQQQVFLPLQQKVLRFLHKRIAETCGSDWHRRSPDENWEAVSYDIGPLPCYIRLFLRFCPAGIQEAAAAWRDVRHTVAHNVFLPFEKLNIAMEALKRL